MCRAGKIGSGMAANVTRLEGLADPLPNPALRHLNSRDYPPLRGVGTVTVVTKVRVTSVAAATALVIGSVGVVLAVNSGRPEASNITGPSPSDVTPTQTPSTSASPTAALPPPLLLPNMRSLSASDLSIEVVGGVRRLRFAASLANVGPGPLLLVPRARGECRSGQHEAVQVLRRDRNRDGVFQRARDREGSRRVTGCMLHHSGHDH